MPLFRCPPREQRRRLRGQQLPRGQPGARHDGRAGRAGGASCAHDGISLVLDFVFNHTSDEHAWAQARAGRRPRVPGLLPDLPRPHHARRLRAHPARDLPRRRAAAASPGVPDCRHGRWVWTTFYTLPVGSQLRQPAVFRRHGRGDAVPGQPGRGDPAPGRGGLHLEASSAPPARTCPRRTCSIQAFNALAAHRRPGRCSSSPRRSSTPTRSLRYIGPASASSPTTRC